MKIILFLLILPLLTACSYLKPKHNLALGEKRMPVENCNFIKAQKKEVEEQQVSSVINEYRFNENFDDTPVEEVSLTQAAPNYMEPMDIDTQVGLGDDASTPIPQIDVTPPHESVNTDQTTIERKPSEKVHYIRHKRKEYPKLKNVPKRKTAVENHQDIVTNKRQELHILEEKSHHPVEGVKSTKPSPMTSAVKPSKEEIEMKLKQLQSHASTINIDVKDKIAPAPQPIAKPSSSVVEQNADKPLASTATPAVTTPKQAPTISLPTTPKAVIPPKQAAPIAKPKPAISQPSTNPPTIPTLPTKPSVAPPMPTMPNSPSNVVATPPIPDSLPPPIPTVTAAPTQQASPSPKPSVIPDKPVRKKIKINDDKSVEVYDAPTPPAAPPPPMPPMMPPKK